MKNYLFFLIFLLPSLAFTQNKKLSFGLGCSGTSRILLFDQNDFSKEEQSTIKDLEVVKPSFFFEIGYTFFEGEKIRLKSGLGFRHTRFGTKRYQTPSGTPNITPQYGTTKNVVLQNHEFLYFDCSFSKVKWLKANSVFSKLSLYYNNRYFVYWPTYNSDGKKGITGLTTSDNLKVHKLDLNMSFGFNYFIKTKHKGTYQVQPYASIFCIPYRTIGTRYSYLYFNRDVTGILWDIGIVLHYNLK